MSTQIGIKPNVVGLYGLPGSGKSTLLALLAKKLDPGYFLLYEGSEKIAEACPGGLEGFKHLDYAHQLHYRELAIESIRQECANTRKWAIVAGHYMFWHENSASEVWTAADANTFTHIVYLDVTAAEIERRRSNDMQRVEREFIPTKDLEAWKEAEKNGLRVACDQHNVLYSHVCGEESDLLDEVLRLVHDFRGHTVEQNHDILAERLDEIVAAHRERLETMLLIDADKTLAPEDSGEIFWQCSGAANPLTHLFGSRGYQYDSFRQAMLLYEGVCGEAAFERLCAQVADKISIYPEFLELLRQKVTVDSLGIIVVTCGLGRVWSKVLKRENLSDTVHVIGSGRLSDKFVITPEAKSALATRLQSKHKVRVCAFGDSPLDLPMLQQADEAVVVVGNDSSRSRSMDGALENAIAEHGFRAQQLLLPADCSVSPRLSIEKLPQVAFEDVLALLYPHGRGQLRLVQATDTTSSKLLASPMRDARIAGPDLRRVHEQAGRYLAIEYISNIVGLEPVEILHVSGGHTTGYRLRHEARTSIVACMRAGEPMALGVNQAFPLARLQHANKANDIEAHHLQGQSCVIVVDSVINEGTTIIKFINRIRALCSSIRIIVVAGVAQAASVRDDGPIAQSLDGHGHLTVVVLRVSQNKYTGSGGTDTGNRLFNTTDQKRQTGLVLIRSIS